MAWFNISISAEFILPQSSQGFMLVKYWTMFFLVTILYGAQIKGAWSLSTNCQVTARFTGHSKNVVTQHGTCCMSSFWYLEIGHGTYNLRKFVHCRYSR
jgi:hypothetical protein